MRKFLDSLKKSGSIFGIVGLISGIISDFLQPLAPFISYIFFATTFSSIVLLITLIIRKSLQTQIITAFTFSFLMMIFSGIFYLLQSEKNQESGFLATNIPGIAKMQITIGLLQEDITSIKKSTEKIEDTTEKIVIKLDEIQKEFSSISEKGGIIENPKRPEQYYHNARIYEQRGDYINARKSYNNYFSFKLDFIDPHLRYQKFLKVQEGKSGAREIYSIFYENDKRPIIEFARILLFDPPKRTEMLKAFISKNPDFTPAFYELSKEYSEIRKGTQSLSDKKNELEYLEMFTSLKDEGKFLKFFVDNEIASEWISYTEERIKALSTLSNITKDITFTAGLSNQGWYINLQVIEPTKEILYKIGDEEEYISTGLSGYNDPRTNLEMPNNLISMPKDPETMNTIIYVKYKNINDEIMGPFELKFDGLKEFQKEAKKNLNILGDWVSWDDRKDYERWGFMSIVSERCAISKVKYRLILDTKKSEWQEIELPYLNPKCDLANKNPYETAEFFDQIFYKYEDNPGTESDFYSFTHIDVQLIFYDGESSQIKKFTRPPTR